MVLVADECTTCKMTACYFIHRLHFLQSRHTIADYHFTGYPCDRERLFYRFVVFLVGYEGEQTSFFVNA